MKELFWISLRAPYDSVPHAGGKVHNYYLKNFYKSGRFSIRLLSFCYPDEVQKLDFSNYLISNKIIVLDKGKISKIFRKIMKTIGAPVSFMQYIVVRHSIKKTSRKYVQEGYHPNVVMLQWTEIVILLPFLKKIYQNSKFVCIEEDVTFLKMQRKYERATGIKKQFLKLQHNILKKSEIKALMFSDLVVLNNPKDQRLVIENGIEEKNTFVSIPYFSNMENVTNNPSGHNILYYGAMNRPENEETVIWIMDNVFPELEKKIPDLQFTILGAKPTKRVVDLRRKNVIVTGFVDDIIPYFNNAFCLIAPLQMGAGVKIKILEALSAGIPVLTNQIGIEGIPAKRGVDYLHCETPEEYIHGVMELINNPEMAKSLRANSKLFISKEYDMKNRISKFIDTVDSL